MRNFKKMSLCLTIFLFCDTQIESSYFYGGSQPTEESALQIKIEELEQRIGALENFASAMSENMIAQQNFIDRLQKELGTDSRASLQPTVRTSTDQQIEKMLQQNAQLQAEIGKRQAAINSLSRAQAISPSSMRKIKLNRDAVLTFNQQIAINNQKLSELQFSGEMSINQSRSTLLGRSSSKKNNRKK